MHSKWIQTPLQSQGKKQTTKLQQATKIYNSRRLIGHRSQAKIQVNIAATQTKTQAST